MARPQSSDYLQNFRFQARVVDGADFFAFNPGAVGVEGEAGFQSISFPERTFEVSEYREGTFKYTKKQAGVPSFSDVSFMRGMVFSDTGFYDWGVASLGGAEYRADIAIYVDQRANVSPGIAEKLSQGPARTLILREAFPIRDKPGGDLDATSSEIHIAEIDCAIEWFELIIQA